MNDARCNVSRLELAWVSEDFRVAESVDREPSAEDDWPGGGGDLIGLASGAKVVGIEPTVFGQILAVSYADPGTRLAIDFDLHPARQVLTEVNDVPPGRVALDACRSELPQSPGWAGWDRRR